MNTAPKPQPAPCPLPELADLERAADDVLAAGVERRTKSGKYRTKPKNKETPRERP